MVRKWRVTKNNDVRATFTVSPERNVIFFSLNPKDFKKYCNIMIDEFEFRKLLKNYKEILKYYEDFLESE